MAANSDGLRLQVQRLDNGTFIATFLLGVNGSESERSLESLLNPARPDYDDRGALYYVIVVICIYGISIILMIASLVRKNTKDNGIVNYMKDIDKVRQLERRQQKYRTRLMMQKKKPKNVLRQHRLPLQQRDVMSAGGGKSPFLDNRKSSPCRQWNRSELDPDRDSETTPRSTGAGPGTFASGDHVPLIESKSDPDYGTQTRSRSDEPGVYCYTRTLRPLERGADTEMLMHWDDGALTPEPSSPSLAVLKEEEEEGDNEGDATRRGDVNKDKQITVNINNVETKLLVSVV